MQPEHMWIEQAIAEQSARQFERDWLDNQIEPTSFRPTLEELNALSEQTYVMRVGLLGSCLTYELYSIRDDGKPLVCPIGCPRSHSTFCVDWDEVMPVDWIERRLNQQKEIRAKFEEVYADVPF